MDLSSLIVIHRPKAAASANGGELAPASPLQRDDLFVLDSCQRKLWVATTELLPSSAAAKLRQQGFEVYLGSAGYHFLLRVATGLESQIVGETDIFGQLKEAWSQAARPLTADGPRPKLHPELRKELSPWLQRLFEDTKEIRSRYLQNVGGASYGSLVRKMLHDRLQGPVLLLGAGQIARSIAPYLAPAGVSGLRPDALCKEDGRGELWIWNRSREKLDELESELRPAYRGKLRRIETAEDEAMALREAIAVVLCIPAAPGSEADARRRALWAEGAPNRPVVHLGGMRAECGGWAELPDFQALDDLFALQKAQGEIRSVQVAQAARACDERAKLRGLAASVSIPHGWEDLAVFV